MSKAKNEAPIPQVPDRRLRTRIAVEAGVDLRTVERIFSGETRKPNPLTAAAVDAAMRRLGLAP